MRTNPASALAARVTAQELHGRASGVTAAAALIALLVVSVGVLSAVSPLIAVSVVAAAAVLTLAFCAPATNLTLFVLVTAIVPFGLQNRVGAGLVPSDVLLLSGLFAAGVRLLQMPLDRRRVAIVAIAGVFFLIAAFQVLRGLQAGRGIAEVGFEFRVLLGFGTVLMAIPLLMTPEGRHRLGVGLLAAGLVLGFWGIAQWVLNIPEIDESGAGVRAGVRFTTTGKGQIQGGLYAFPVAVILAAAALILGSIRSRRGRVLVLGVLVLNLVSLLLTYERTFWVATAVGLAFVAVKAAPVQRLRAVLWGAMACVLLFVAFTTIAPGELNAARERLLSIGQYRADDSLRIRLLETSHAMVQVRERPVMGSGLGATIFIGRPWQQVPPVSEWYIHNGYVWLTWKLGLLGAIWLFILLGWAVVARCGRSGDPLFDALRRGSQAALLTLLISSVTFPTFNALSITGTMGVLAAIALACPRSTGTLGADRTSDRLGARKRAWK